MMEPSDGEAACRIPAVNSNRQAAQNNWALGHRVFPVFVLPGRGIRLLSVDLELVLSLARGR
jgi:hypothetical protein